MTDFPDAVDQNRAATEPVAPPLSESEEQAAQEPLAMRRIKKLRRSYPEANPAEIAEHLEKIFVRDFSLIGGAEAGVKNFIPGAVGAATRNSKIAGVTQAAGHLGLINGVSTYTQKAAQGIGATAHVGFSQSIKTFIYSLALLQGLEVKDAEDATTRVLGADVHQLILTMNQPISYAENQPDASPMNVVAAISSIGMRNPQMLLLVKSGEQLVKSGGSMMASSKAHKEFAQQIITQVRENLGEAPAEFPADFAAIEIEDSLPAPDAAPVEVAATPAEQVAATSEEEIQRMAAEETSVSVKGAKLAAKAFTGLFGRR